MIDPPSKPSRDARRTIGSDPLSLAGWGASGRHQDAEDDLVSQIMESYGAVPAEDMDLEKGGAGRNLLDIIDPPQTELLFGC